MVKTLAADIVEAVAEAEGTDSTELSFVLHDYINTDALEMLANAKASSWALTFELPDHEVTVTGDGTIFVDGDRELLWA